MFDPINLYSAGTSVSHAELTVVGPAIVVGLAVIAAALAGAVVAHVATATRKPRRPARPAIIRNAQEG